MNGRIQELANIWANRRAKDEKLGIVYTFSEPALELFAELIVRECSNAVLSVPCYYKDYRSQIEEAVINDCARTVLEHFGVEE